LTFFIQVTNWMSGLEITSTIAIIGYLLGALFNPLVNITYLLYFIIGKKIWTIIPPWLIIANIVFLIMQFFYILYLNDTLHS
ncbi:MAG TPA: hypothetical protein VJ499_15005, partial [Flavisolibacter sp.]|nr:hypothetical protein [Flavisolibacter sp.]